MELKLYFTFYYSSWLKLFINVDFPDIFGPVITTPQWNSNKVLRFYNFLAFLFFITFADLERKFYYILLSEGTYILVNGNGLDFDINFKSDKLFQIALLIYFYYGIYNSTIFSKLSLNIFYFPPISSTLLPFTLPYFSISFSFSIYLISIYLFPYSLTTCHPNIFLLILPIFP